MFRSGPILVLRAESCKGCSVFAHLDAVILICIVKINERPIVYIIIIVTRFSLFFIHLEHRAKWLQWLAPFPKLTRENISHWRCQMLWTLGSVFTVLWSSSAWFTFLVCPYSPQFFNIITFEISFRLSTALWIYVRSETKNARKQRWRKESLLNIEKLQWRIA
jgi:hypothetical protein